MALSQVDTGINKHKSVIKSPVNTRCAAAQNKRSQLTTLTSKQLPRKTFNYYNKFCNIIISNIVYLKEKYNLSYSEIEHLSRKNGKGCFISSRVINDAKMLGTLPTFDSQCKIAAFYGLSVIDLISVDLRKRDEQIAMKELKKAEKESKLILKTQFNDLPEINDNI